MRKPPWRIPSKAQLSAQRFLFLILLLSSALCRLPLSGEMCVAAAVLERPSGQIRLNTVGYLPEAPKVASIAAECSSFSVRRCSDNEVVLRKAVIGPHTNEDTQEEIYFADFASVSTPGEYYLEVPQVGMSPVFRVEKDLYRRPFKLISRGMYQWRCGTDVTAEIDGHRYEHGPCHLCEASLELVDSELTPQPSTGGWHDAGDYNKYVANGAMTVGMMLRAWEDFGPAIESTSLDLPEQDPHLPEFLAELKWELDWLLTMQASDGSVYTKLSTAEFCGMVPPEADSAQQYFAPWSSDSTADFVAVMSHAFRTFNNYDNDLANRYLRAALNGYNFLRKHPERHASLQSLLKTGRYQSDDRDERLWAAAEIWESTGRTDALSDLERRLKRSRRKVDFHWDWHNVRNLGVLCYLTSQRPGRNVELVDSVEQSLITTADRIVEASRRHGYARPLGTRYYWGCNGSVARQAFVLERAARMTGNAKYRQVALDGLNHLLGRNYYGRSFVTGLGFKPPMNPHDRRSASDDVNPPWPGYLVGGAHPNATDWQDVESDFRTNEIAINWNGALIYAAAMFLSGSEPQVNSDNWGDHNFNRDWQFREGDHPEAQLPEYDDFDWRTVRLPHDWAVEQPFDPNLDGSTGRLPWKGVGWYRKQFDFDGNDTDRVYLEFDGVMAFPEIYVNGQLAGRWDYGYTPFVIDVSPHLEHNQTNSVAVRVDTRKHHSRWYPGAGIYRNVTLKVRSPIHFAPWSTFITTPAVADDHAKLQFESVLENHGHATTCQWVCTVQDPNGTIVGNAHRQTVEIKKGTVDIACEFDIERPQRWDIDSPHLYTVVSEVIVDGREIDREETPFGFRTFKFTADDGFHLNGRRVQIQGVNLHHDHGPLGAAFNRRAMQRQLEIMKDMGVNAIRTSHNPAAKELLELCDEMGLLVWNECFDKWDATAGRRKGLPAFEPYVERQILNFVSRDRNHPSVVVWSIGNEIPNQPYDTEGKSRERVSFLREAVLKSDPTRPVAMGCFIPETSGTDILADLDVTGWNYLRRYEKHRERFPRCPIVYSESASTLSSRGHYALPLPAAKSSYGESYQLSSYDLNSAPWSDVPDVEFQRMKDDSFVAGEFVWTGFDYLGEPTPFEQHARSSYFGIVDLCGMPKDRYFLYRSIWRPDSATTHVLPHWNWPERIGKNVPVFVYTNGDSAELFLDGVSQGKRHKGVKPIFPASFVLPGSATCSSQGPRNTANMAGDADISTRWCAADSTANQWWQTDLGTAQSVKCLVLEFEHEAKHYGYNILVSNDQDNWKSILVQKPSSTPRWGGPHHVSHRVDFKARYIRVQFTEISDNKWASIREFSAFPAEVEPRYYEPTYNYRLRWNNVVYEPGELKVVAYQGEKQIGETSVLTAGEPAALRLSPDRTRLAASGEDLCYVLVEAVDDKGTLCPLAHDVVQFRIEGPATIAGVGNGNPLSLEPFKSNKVALFHGKAMLILQTFEDQPGTIRIHAESDPIGSKRVECYSQ